MKSRTFYSIGMFGVPNLGDELLSLSVVTRLQAMYHDCVMHVLALDAQMASQYTGMEVNYVEGFWPTRKYFKNLRSHLLAIRNSDLLVIGGGGLLADYYTWTSIPRYCIDALWATVIGRRYVFVGIGVGKIRRKWLRLLVRFISQNAVAIYCRDRESTSRIREITKRGDIVTAPDLANMIAKSCISDKAVAPSKIENYALVNLREQPPIDSEKATSLCHQLLAHFGQLVLMSAEPADTAFYKHLMTGWSTQETAATRIVEPTTLKEAIWYIRHASAVAAERLHVNLLSVYANIPLLTINYEGKVEQFIASLGGTPLIYSLEEIGEEAANRLIGMESSRNSQKLEDIRHKAQNTFDNLVEAGLSAPRCSYWNCTKAIGWLLLLLLVGICWVFASTVKNGLCRR